VKHEEQDRMQGKDEDEGRLQAVHEKQEWTQMVVEELDRLPVERLRLKKAAAGVEDPSYRDRRPGEEC
jgi:hypothetical protein